MSVGNRYIVPVFLALAWSSVAAAEEIRYVYSLTSVAPTAGETDFTYQLVMARNRGPTTSGAEALPGRPFGPDAVEQWVGLQYGLTRSLAVAVQTVQITRMGGPMEYGSVRFDTRFRMKSPAGVPVDVALAGGCLREAGGTSVIQATGAISKDWGPANLTGNIQAEKALAPGRDPVDMILTAGGSYRVSSRVRIGVEYAGQDLEAAWETDEAEGGARHLLGPTAAFGSAGGDIQIAVSPSLTLTPLGAGVVLRGALSYSF